MDNNKITTIGMIALSALVVIIALPTACTVKTNKQVVEMVQAGADPLDAACAIKGGDDQGDRYCIAASQRGAH